MDTKVGVLYEDPINHGIADTVHETQDQLDFGEVVIYQGFPALEVRMVCNSYTACYLRRSERPSEGIGSGTDIC